MTMIETIQDVQSALEAQGLLVSVNNPSSLLIGGSVVDAGDGVRIFKDACALNRREDAWVAVLPAEGLLTYEVPGELPDLVSLISAVYHLYRRTGGPFKDACKQVVSALDQYLVGGPLTRV
jgi:hypothetical protein